MGMRDRALGALTAAAAALALPLAGTASAAETPAGMVLSAPPPPGDNCFKRVHGWGRSVKDGKAYVYFGDGSGKDRKEEDPVIARGSGRGNASARSSSRDRSEIEPIGVLQGRALRHTPKEVNPPTGFDPPERGASA